MPSKNVFQSLLIASITFFSATTALAAPSEKSAYDQVIAGKKCTESASQQIDCDYHVGKDLWISIAGIGLPDTAVTFMKSSFEGDFFATYGVMHGCVIVKRGKKNPVQGAIEAPDFAFISPKNGKVYHSWTKCQAGM